MTAIEKPDIDPDHIIEREINGCKVTLLFSKQRNEKVERLVLDNLMLAFERRVHKTAQGETK